MCRGWGWAGKLCLYGNIRWNVSSETPQGGGSNKKSQLPQTQKINTPLGLWSNKHWQHNVYVCVCGGICLSMATYAGMSYQKRLREAALIRHHSCQEKKQRINTPHGLWSATVCKCVWRVSVFPWGHTLECLTRIASTRRLQ